MRMDNRIDVDKNNQWHKENVAYILRREAK
jgi:hypothetical protein